MPERYALIVQCLRPSLARKATYIVTESVPLEGVWVGNVEPCVYISVALICRPHWWKAQCSYPGRTQQPP